MSKQKTRGSAKGRARAAKCPALREALDADSALQVLDIRARWSYDAGHIVGAINIPTARVAKEAPELFDVTRPLWVICNHGNESRFVATSLSSLGFDVIDVRDGMQGWRSAGYPVSAGSGLARLGTPLIASLGLGLAPFAPPHIIEKIGMITTDVSQMAPIDWFDVVLHGAPWVWLLWTLVDVAREAIRKK